MPEDPIRPSHPSAGNVTTMHGRLVILSGPSGVGKDSVLDAWRAIDPQVHRVVAYTTRDPRVGEVDTVDYHFVTRERFADLITEGAFLEHKEVHGNGYATPLFDMEALLEEGKIAVLKIDVQGAQTAMHLRPDALSIFLLPPSIEELTRRIVGRGTDAPEVIEKRMRNALEEIDFSVRYGHQVVNEDLAATVKQLQNILSGQVG
jgi:guanylate kinase